MKSPHIPPTAMTRWQNRAKWAVRAGIIFGVISAACLIGYCFTWDTAYAVAAFECSTGMWAAWAFAALFRWHVCSLLVVQLESKLARQGERWTPTPHKGKRRLEWMNLN